MLISVIICTYNRDKYIGRCLENLLTQTAEKHEYEVVLVNNNSTDHTFQVWTNFYETNKPENFRYILETNQGLSFARNRGISEAKGDIISFIDDDAFARKDFIKNIILFFNKVENLNIQAAGGKIIPEFEESRPDWMSSYLLPLIAALDMGEQQKAFPKKKFPLGANMIFRKELFDKVGFFNPKLGRTGSNLMGSEEKDLFSRIRKENNAPVLYLPQVEVKHIIPPSRLTMDYIRKQAFGIGKSEKIRVKEKGTVEILKKILEELVKIGGTFVLSFIYLIKFQAPKALMLLKFRYWVLKGYICKDLVK